MTRFGMGYDVHQLVENRKLIIGGVDIPYEKGLLGHSDADVLLHAISDALLGAAALGDIGKHFPDTDPRYKGADSLKLLEEVGNLLAAKGYVVGIPGRVVVMHGKRVGKPVYTDEMMKLMDEDVDSQEMVDEQDVDLNHDELPDPVRDLIADLAEKLDKMEKRVNELEKELENKNA